MTYDPRRFGARCDECPLKGCSPVTPKIQPEPGLVIIGDSPSYEDDRQHAPFLGGAGRTLDHALKAAGTSRSAVSLTHAVLCRPEGDGDLSQYLASIKRQNKAKRAEFNRELRVQKKLRSVSEKAAREVRNEYKRAVKSWQAECTRLLRDYTATVRRIQVRNARMDEEDQVSFPEMPDLPLEPPVPYIPEVPDIPVMTEMKAALWEDIPSPVDCCRPRLLYETRKAKALLLAGKQTFTLFTGIKPNKLLSEQGFPRKVTSLDGRTTQPAIAVIHPMSITKKLESYRGAWTVWVKRAVEMARDGFPEWRDPKPFYTQWRVELVLKELLRLADNAVRLGQPPIDCAVDVETSGLDPVCDQLRCVGLTYSKTTAIVTIRSVHGQSLREAGSFAALQKVLVHPGVRKIFHNGTFDQAFLWSQVGPVAGPCGDTLLAHHALESEVPHNLSFLASLTLPAPSWKSLGDDTHGLTVQDDKQLWLYNGIDTNRTLQILPNLEPVIDADGLRAVYETDVALQPIVAKMTARGLKLHRPSRTTVQARLETEYSRCFAEMMTALDMAGANSNPVYLEALAGEPFSPTRPAHVGAAIHVLGLEEFLPRTKKTEKISVKGDDLSRAIVRANPAARMWIGSKLDAARDGNGYLGAQSCSKAISTFCKTEPAADGRVRASWKQHGTVSGRMSCSGPNLMNIPEWMRVMYQPPCGRVYVAADYSAVELRVNGICSHATNLMRALNSSDVHRSNTEGLFNLKFYDKLTVAARTGCDHHKVISDHQFHLIDAGKKFSCEWATTCPDCRAASEAAFHRMVDRLGTLRRQAKAFVFAKNYQGSDQTIWLKCLLEFPDMLLSEVVAMSAMWSKVNPELEANVRKNVDLFYRRKLKAGFGYLESPILGRRRYWTGKEFGPTDAANFPIQSGAGDVINLATIRVDPIMRKLGGELVAQVHDAVLYEVPEKKAEQAKKILEEVLPGDYKFRDVDGRWSFPVEAKIGSSWAEV